ncbi:MAG: hypothetical protein ABJN26_00050 [Stappiaceae bacterium]
MIYGQPIGSVHWCPYENPYPGCLMLTDQRQTLSRTTYADLWTWITTNAGTALAVSDAAAEDGQFGPGDGSTTFSLPKAAGYFLRVKGGVDPDARVLGSVQADAIRETNVAFRDTAADYTSTGASNKNIGNNGGTAIFNADTGVDEYETTTNSGYVPAKISEGGVETRSINFAWNICITAFHTVDDAAQVNAAAILAEQVSQAAQIAALETSNLQMLGVGQTWQDLTASRSINTTYQNTTGNPIQVYLAINGSGSTTSTQLGDFELSTDEATWLDVFRFSGGINGGGGGAVIVPDNYYYRYTGASGILRWYELQ